MNDKEIKVSEKEVNIFFGGCCEMGEFLLGTLTHLVNGEKNLVHLRADIKKHVELYKGAIGD